MSNNYYYLTERDIIRESDEEWLYNEEFEEYGWYEVSCLSMGDHFQKGVDEKVRRKRKLPTE